MGVNPARRLPSFCKFLYMYTFVHEKKQHNEGRLNKLIEVLIQMLECVYVFKSFLLLCSIFHNILYCSRSILPVESKLLLFPTRLSRALKTLHSLALAQVDTDSLLSLSK